MAHDLPIDIVMDVGEESRGVVRGEGAEHLVDFIRCGVGGGHFWSTNTLVRDEVSELLGEDGSELYEIDVL